MDPMAFKYIAVGLMAFGMLGAALGIGKIFAALLEGVSRNPAAEAKLARYALIGAGMTEALGIFALGIALILIFV